MLFNLQNKSWNIRPLDCHIPFGNGCKSLWNQNEYKLYTDCDMRTRNIIVQLCICSNNAMWIICSDVLNFYIESLCRYGACYHYRLLDIFFRFRDNKLFNVVEYAENSAGIVYVCCFCYMYVARVRKIINWGI